MPSRQHLEAVSATNSGNPLLLHAHFATKTLAKENKITAVLTIYPESSSNDAPTGKGKGPRLIRPWSYPLPTIIKTRSGASSEPPPLLYRIKSKKKEITKCTRRVS